MIEIDLVFPLNQTYTLIDPFPGIFFIQNAAAAWNFGFDFQWNISGVPDGSSSSEVFGPGFLFEGQGLYHPAPSDPFIVVNSTRFPSAIVNTQLPAGKWTLGWSYESSICTQNGDILNIGSGIPAQGSISFTVEGGGASPDFTSSCPILAGQIDIVANWTGCPQLGTAGPSNPCGAKIDAAQASSISAILALGTSTSSAMGGSLASGAAGTLTMSGSSASGATSTTTSASITGTTSKTTNIAGREQLGSGLLGAAAGIAGLGILLL
jgi:hypothetical protein